MKNKKKVWIRGVEGRGEEVLNALKALGGKMKQDNPLSGEDDQWIYTITHEGFIEAWPVTSEIYKIIKDNYREIRLSEHWKDGTIVFSQKDCTFAADRLTVNSDTKIEIPMKNGIICIDRVEGLEHERLMITSNNSKMFRRMWVYPLTSDAIVVEIK